jgi:LysM repeat protein
MLWRMKSRVVAVGFGALSVLGVAACGSGSGTGAAPATTIKIGTPSYQTLAPVVTSTTTAPTVVGQVPGTPVAGEQSYTVVSGDYLYGIAKKFCVKAEDIGVYNGWTEGVQHALVPGQAIKIPPNGCLPGTATQTTDAATVATTPAVTSTTFDVASGATYTVVTGDYLGGIATKVGTTVDAIIAANGWTDGVDHVIIPGQTIKLPAKTSG